MIKITSTPTNTEINIVSALFVFKESVDAELVGVGEGDEESGVEFLILYLNKNINY
jgi:hypothetical protein